MFGFKTIREDEFNKLMHMKEEAEERIREAIEAREKIEQDCKSLRKQLGEKMKEINRLNDKMTKMVNELNSLRYFKRDTLEAMGQIDLAGFQLHYCTRKCKHCDNEQHDCKKYEFGKHQYCVMPKSNT